MLLLRSLRPALPGSVLRSLDPGYLRVGLTGWTLTIILVLGDPNESLPSRWTSERQTSRSFGSRKAQNGVVYIGLKRGRDRPAKTLKLCVVEAI